MSMTFEFDDQIRGEAKITVLGVGGGGGNALDSMISFGLKGVEFVAINTDAQALNKSTAERKIQIGLEKTGGLGAGANPEVGKESMLETVKDENNPIYSIMKDSDMVFIAAGMGGGTGTGAAPVVAEIAKEKGVLTVGVVTKPFKFEGGRRMSNAQAGIERLKQNVDTLLVVDNEKLLNESDVNLSFVDAFKKVDKVLYDAVSAVSDLITQKGMINLDFADVKSTISEGGDAMMGIGIGSGEHRCIEAAQDALNNTLLEDFDIEFASSILVNICSSKDLSLTEMNDAMELIHKNDRRDLTKNVIFGTAIDDTLGEKVKISVIATGFKKINNKGEERRITPKADYLDKYQEYSSKYSEEKECSKESKVEEKDTEIETTAKEIYHKFDYEFDLPAILRRNKD